MKEKSFSGLVNSIFERIGIRGIQLMVVIIMLLFALEIFFMGINFGR